MDFNGCQEKMESVYQNFHFPDICLEIKKRKKKCDKLFFHEHVPTPCCYRICAQCTSTRDQPDRCGILPSFKQTLWNAAHFRKLAEEVAGRLSSGGQARPQTAGGDDGGDSPNDAERRSSAAIETALILQVLRC